MKRIALVVVLAATLSILACGVSYGWWLETQLAGIRLGDPAMVLLDEPGYGNPDGIIVTTARGAPAATVAPGGAPAAGEEAAAPEEEAAAEEEGAVEEEAPGPRPPLGMARGYGNIPPAVGVQLGMGLVAPGFGTELQLAGPTLTPSQYAAPALQAAGATALQQAQAGAGVPVTLPGGAEGLLTGPASGVGVFPDWVLSVWFDLRDDEIEWFYIRQGVAVGVVINKNTWKITAISVAGDKCDFARTANWQPHRYIKLGDSFKRVIQRYGYPHDIETFVGGGQWTSPISSGSLTFGTVTNEFRRDVILWYHETRGDKQCNIAFTLHDMKVTRIHIWIPDVT